jgi:broad specificity phosphatase PhoE
MTTIYLIRHGQAGTRDNYDLLSELGTQQARLLGDHLSARNIEFSAVYAGGMSRQRRTAEIVCGQLSRNGDSAPEIIGDERWNEISLAEIYRGIARRMSEESPEFACDFEEMQEALRLDPHTTRGATGRCDAGVIRAWMENRYPDYPGESWPAFRARIQTRMRELAAGENGDAIAVFTSATPIAIITGAALGLTDEKLLRVLGVLYNSGVTVMRPSGEDLRLLTFNSAAHLPGELVTFR